MKGFMQSTEPSTLEGLLSINFVWLVSAIWMIWKKHEAKHDDFNHFKCKGCDSSFFSKGELKKHVVLTHPKQKLFPCPECPEAFKCYHTQALYKRTHKRFQWDHCTLDFNCASYFKHHVEAHSSSLPAKPFQCEKCPASFSKNQERMRHELCHLGI